MHNRIEMMRCCINKEGAQMLDRITAAVERRQDELIAAVQDLVRIPSLTGEEGAAQAFMARRLTDLGFAVTQFEADPAALRHHPEYIDQPWPYQGRPNVIGKIQGARPGAPSLILNGHVDVVSPEPLSAWTRDPWGAQIEGDRLYGRGAWDMKGGLLAAVYAVRSLLDAGLQPAGDVSIHSVIEEEAGGTGGTLACLEAGHRADAMICVEPGWMAVVAHPGINYFRVRVLGRSAHAGRAHTGVNAIGKMNRLYDALIALDAHRAATARYELFDRTFGRSCHLNIGTYRAGDWASTVAGSAVMECRISYVPGERFEDVKAQVEAAVAEACRGDEWLQEHPPEIEWYGWRARPWVQDPAHPLIGALQGAAARVGRPAPVSGKTAGLDTRFAAYCGMAALSFGPDGGSIHGPDEYASISSLIETCKVLALTIAVYSGIV
jgi:acetylornithine deacetylase